MHELLRGKKGENVRKIRREREENNYVNRIRSEIGVAIIHKKSGLSDELFIR